MKICFLTWPTAPVQDVVFSSNLPQVELQFTHEGAALLLLRKELMISQSYEGTLLPSSLWESLQINVFSQIRKKYFPWPVSILCC